MPQAFLRLIWLLAMIASFFVGPTARAQGTSPSGASTNGLVCSSNPTNGSVPVSVTYSSPTGSFTVTAAKNSLSNPIVLAYVQVNLTGCTLYAPGGSNQTLMFYLPAPGDMGIALRSPLQGISAQVSGTPVGNISGGGTGCGVNSTSFMSYDYYQASYLNIWPRYYSNSPTVFTNCTVSLSYTMAFYANGSLSNSNGKGTFSTSLFNGNSIVSSAYAGDVGWGRLQSSWQGQSSINTYSYQFSGAGFNVSLGSCTPAVSVSGSANATVTLPSVFSNKLNGAGQTTGTTPFTISLGSCYNTGSNYSATAYWTYTSFNSSYPNVIANTASTSPATAVGVQISETTSGSPVLANNATGATTWNINSSTNSAPGQTFNAYYYSTGTTNLTGNVTGVANYTMSYN